MRDLCSHGFVIFNFFFHWLVLLVFVVLVTKQDVLLEGVIEDPGLLGHISKTTTGSYITL